MDDHGHLQVLEAMLVTLVLLGTIFAVTAFRLPSSEGEREVAAAQNVAKDALTVLAGLRDANGTALDAGFQEALHCILDPVPSTGGCHQGRGRNLSLRIDSYLPEGASSMLAIHNGAATREIWSDGVPPGQASTATFAFLPDWNLTFITVDLSCHESTQDVNVTLIPIRQGNRSSATSVAVKLDNAVTATAERAPQWGVWNATLLAATRPASGVATASVVAKDGAFAGATRHAACALEGQGPALKNAVRDAELTIGGPVRVGDTVTFTADLASLAAFPGATLGAVNVTVYEPIAPRNGEPDTFAPQALVPLPTGAAPSASWLVPSASLYGAHPVLLRAQLTIQLPSSAVVEVEARLAGVLEVALPTGAVPYGSPYTAILQVWFDDWQS